MTNSSPVTNSSFYEDLVATGVNPEAGDTDDDVSFEFGFNSGENKLPKNKGTAENDATKKPMQTIIPALQVPDGLVVQCAASIRPEPIKWLWRYRIPLGKLSCFAGNPDVGKSMITLDVAARLTTGRDWPDGPNTNSPCDVLLLGAEDGYADTVIPRLRAAGADLNRVHILESLARDSMKKSARLLALDTDTQRICELLRNNPQIKLLIVDPISSYLGKKAKMNDEQSAREVLTPLSHAMQGAECGCLYVAHFNKSIDLSAIHKVGGAVAIVGLARITWGFAKSPDNPESRLMTRIKGNIAKDVGGLSYRFEEVVFPGESDREPIETARIEWEGSTAETMDDILTAARIQKPDVRKQDEAVEWLRRYMPKDGSEVLSKVLEADAHMAGFKGGTLNRAKGRLGLQNTQRPKGTGPWYCWLPVDTGAE